ncbi:hypothetical protein ABH945_002937 [Paraburkholderia sp. GAS333]
MSTVSAPRIGSMRNAFTQQVQQHGHAALRRPRLMPDA